MLKTSATRNNSANWKLKTSFWSPTGKFWWPNISSILLKKKEKKAGQLARDSHSFLSKMQVNYWHTRFNFRAKRRVRIGKYFKILN